MKNKSVCVCVKYIYTDNIYTHTDMQLCGVYVYIIYTHKIYIYTDTYNIHAYIYTYALFMYSSIYRKHMQMDMQDIYVCTYNMYTQHTYTQFNCVFPLQSHKSLPNDQNLISLCLFNTILSSIICKIKHS